MYYNAYKAIFKCISCLKLKVELFYGQEFRNKTSSRVDFIKSCVKQSAELRPLSRRTADLFQLSLLLLERRQSCPFRAIPFGCLPAILDKKHFRAAWIFYLSVRIKVVYVESEDCTALLASGLPCNLL